MTWLLMMVCSAGSINLASDKGHTTGYWADEVLKPYDKCVAAGVEVVVAPPDGAPPHADPFGLEPRFHYPDEDKDFLSQVVRSFAPDMDDILVTLHHFSELDLIAARRVFYALVDSGLDRDTAWSAVTRGARTAWRDDRNFIDVLSTDSVVTSTLTPHHLPALAYQLQDESAAQAKQLAERLPSF